ncbi:MFS transporter [Pseudomonas sp. BW13M1]|uniref:MFS transporter n=1 Tax=Pseudomonas peradeniyensis TaxID=2745488 RepID=A0A923GDF8_9PSED|nr:MFS transporter [Pseudomonas peradeniyensis]MBV4504260.1 MFS transporter [Pseudomonas peradeniyensis]
MTIETQPAQHTETGRLLPVATAVFLGLMTMGMPLASVPLWVHGQLGYGMLMVGCVMGVESLATLLTRHFAGTVADRRGPKRAVVLGLLGSAVSGLCYLLAAQLQDAPAASLAAIIVGRIAMGFAQSLLFTGGSTWPIALFGAEQAGKALSWIGIAMFAGIACGAAVAAQLGEVASFAWVSAVTAIIPLFGLLVALRTPAARLVHASGASMPLAALLARIWRPGLVFALATVGYVSVSSFITLTYAHHQWSGAGYALAAFGAGYVCARLLFGARVDSTAGPGMALSMLAIEAIGQLLLWLAASPAQAMLGAALSGFGVSMIYPLLALVALRAVPLHSLGLAIGFYDACFDISIGLTAPLAGLLARQQGVPAVFLIGVLASLVAMLAALCAYRHVVDGPRASCSRNHPA